MMKQKINSIANEVITESEISLVFTDILGSVFSFAKKDVSQNRNSQNKKIAKSTFKDPILLMEGFKKELKLDLSIRRHCMLS